MPAGNGETVVMVSVGGLMTREYDWVAVAPDRSVAWTVKLKVPAVCGVPCRSPVVALRVKPPVSP